MSYPKKNVLQKDKKLNKENLDYNIYVLFLYLFITTKI